MLSTEKQSAGKGAKGPTRAAKIKAESLKAVGNEELKAGNFEEAIAAYSGAIAADPSCATYYSNRAFTYLKVLWI